MSYTNPPPGGDNQNYTPPPQAQPPYQQPPYQQPPPPPPPPRQMPQLNMQNLNQLIKSVPQLVRVLRWIAWAELIAIVGLGIIGFCSSATSFGLYYGGGITAFTSLLVTVLQALAYWGLLMGVALLLENQAGGQR